MGVIMFALVNGPYLAHRCHGRLRCRGEGFCHLKMEGRESDEPSLVGLIFYSLPQSALSL